MMRILRSIAATLVASALLGIASPAQTHGGSPRASMVLMDEAVSVLPISRCGLERSDNRVEIVSTTAKSGILLKGDWDLSDYRSIRFTVENHDPKRHLMLTMAMTNEEVVTPIGKAPKKGRLGCKHDVAPGGKRTVEIDFPVLPHPEVDDAFYRMANSPYSYAYKLYSYRIDLSKVVQMEISSHKQEPGVRWSVSDIELVTGEKATPEPWLLMGKDEFFPFIDEYGQFIHNDWPGKVHSDKDLKRAIREERKDMARNPGAGNWSKYGGWKDGPRLEATGRFRTQKVDGKWWMVDPEGYLFWSHGVVRVNASSAVTPLEGRNVPDRRFYYRNLPKEGDKFAHFYTTQDDLLKLYYDLWGITDTYDFSSANLFRKYGPDYLETYGELAHKRLRSWGLNTISNSSDRDICLMDKTPYVDRFHIQATIIEGTGGSNWKFADPFADSFSENVRKQLEESPQSRDPWCIGLFVDNEHKWGDTQFLAECAFKAPASQPAKLAMVEWLKEKYSRIVTLNSLWGSNFASWEAVVANRTAAPAKAKDDLREFNQQIIQKYFGTIKRIFNEVAPGCMYLGCRFSNSNEDVVRIAAQYTDALSYNKYYYSLDDFRLPEGVDKPVIIGEFHFGAMDRGMFHSSIIDVESQEARGEAYKHYVTSALRHPNIVGTQWHQYADQATTGRFDGENYQVGLLDVCDTPYYETIGKIREIGYNLYEVRDGAAAPDIVLTSGKDVEILPNAGAKLDFKGDSITVTSTANSSGVVFKGDFDLSGHNRLRFTVHNQDPVQYLQMIVQVQEELEKASVTSRTPKGTMTNQINFKPGETREIEILFPPVVDHADVDSCFTLMRNTPYYYGGHYSYNLDLSSIKAVKFLVRRYVGQIAFTISDVRVLGGKRVEPAPWMKMPKEEFFPFIDSYGQFKHNDWPGKIHSDADLAKVRADEEKDLAAHAGADDWSKYGGWKNGPRREATGQFRVEKVDGKWWMVDPEGYLFWSHGVVRVSTSSGITPLEGADIPDRRYYFENLPPEDERDEFGRFYFTHDALLKPYYTFRNITDTYDFSSANAYRKYGPDYKSAFADMAHRRLKSWGLNTIANSSDKDICLMDRTVYTDRFEVVSEPIAGTYGWWPFMDPFDPSFAKALETTMLAHKKQLDDPWCLGFFVDNEIQWGGKRSLAQATLKAPAKQAAKVAMVRWLEGKYVGIEELNKAWESGFASWQELLDNTSLPGPSANKDLAEFNRRIIEAYFSTVRGTFKAIAPDKLYLGCRFSNSNEDVVRIAAKYCDVLSYNVYRNNLDFFRLYEGIDKPVMIGEFHFGAMDRGMFHPGQVFTESQEDRAESYYEYVSSALRHPNVIGTHWHQFSDQAATGRFDGENFQVGFTDICDTPYPETIAKVREVGYQMYRTRSGNAGSRKTRYVDAKELTIVGQALPFPEKAYSRMDGSAYGLEGSMLFKSEQSTGMMVAFSTDSRSIKARWRTSDNRAIGTNCGANAQKGLDLYIKSEERWVFAGVGKPTLTQDSYADHNATLVSDMAEGWKECVLYLPLFDRVDELEIGVDEGSEVRPLANPFKHRIVFHGSSITHGSAASRAGMSYVARFGRDNGLYCINSGFSGQCKLQEEFAHYLADVQADAFVFDAFSNPDASMIEERFDKFVDIIREAHPTTPLIFLQTIRREGRNFNLKVEAREAAKQEAGERMVRARMERDPNIHFISSDGFLGDDSIATSDGTHPTDVGFSRMLDGMTAPLLEILGGYGIRGAEAGQEHGPGHRYGHGRRTKVKVVSYNIRYLHGKDKGENSWEERKVGSVNMFRAERPDVAGVQESELPQVEYLLSELPDYDHFAVDREAGLRENGQHLMVMWLRDKYELLDKGSFWLSQTPDVPSFGWDARSRRLTVWVKLRDKRTGAEFHCFNTHLDHRGDEARLNGASLNVEMMQRIVGEDGVVFLTGDMNSDRAKPSGRFLAPYDQWMEPARESARKTDDRETFNAFKTDESKTTGTLDHIFYRGASALRYETLDSEKYLGRYISDHYPIACTFKF